MNRFFKKKSGFIALTSVIILSGVFIVIFISIFFMAYEESDRGIDLENSLGSYSLATTCLEIALRQLSQDQNYTGNHVESFPEGNCYVEELVNFSEDMVLIITRGEKSDYYKTIEAEVDTSFWPELEIIEWR